MTLDVEVTLSMFIFEHAKFHVMGTDTQTHTTATQADLH